MASGAYKDERFSENLSCREDVPVVDHPAQTEEYEIQGPGWEETIHTVYEEATSAEYRTCAFLDESPRMQNMRSSKYL